MATGSSDILVHNTPPCYTGVSRQAQDAHLKGTRQYNERIRNGTPTSTFNSRAEAHAYAEFAWKNGTPVPGRPNVRNYEFGRPVGRGPNGGWQTKVRVHINGAGRVRAHPKGKEYFN